jgi:hypothetical protein
MEKDREALERIIESLGLMQDIIRTVLENPVFKKTAPAPEPAKRYTLEEVRGKLAKLAAGGMRVEVKEIINAAGFAKLSDIPAEKYQQIMEEAAKLG